MKLSSILIPSISELFDFCMLDKLNVYAYTVIGTLSNEEVNKFESIYNIDFCNYQRIIDSYAIRHILKNHGNVLREDKRGQIAINKQYIEKIPEIVTQFDNVIGDGLNKIGRLTFKYEKLEKNTYVVVEEIRTNNKFLALDTMRIYKAKAVIR